MAYFAITVSKTCFDRCRAFGPAGKCDMELEAGLDMLAQLGKHGGFDLSVE